MADISEAYSDQDLGAVKALLLEYGHSLGFERCFDRFDEELDGLPGAYAPPLGCLLLAREAGEAAGCVGARPLRDGVCEMKRLYVRPAFRGRGLGRALAEAAVAAARGAGYRRMELMTLSSMMAAIALYGRLGFAPAQSTDRRLPHEVVLKELRLEPGVGRGP